MSDFQQFELKEVFKTKDFEKLPDSLRLDKTIKEEGKLYRLLIGSIEIRNNVTGESIQQKKNYSVLGGGEMIRFSKKIFTEPFSASTTLDDIENYLKNSNPANRKLFQDLINEYCYYFYFRSREIHTLAFIYAYRILERISYTFPMLYASKATDYVGSFTKLQNYFNGSNSELKFLNLFINDFFEDEFLKYKVKIDITAHNEEIRKNYYSILKGLCKNNNPNIEMFDQKEFTDFTIENKDTLNLMIHLRNRYFHFASGGQRNINSSEMIEPNHFYGLLNDHFANWLAVVYFQIIKKLL